MPRTADTDRLIGFLQNQGGASNLKVKTSLGLNDARYDEVKNALLSEGLIERYVCRGGGIALTKKGERQRDVVIAESAVENEAALYNHYVNILTKEMIDNGETGTVADISALRSRGKWSNPDVLKISYRHYPTLRTHKILVSTYELKQLNRWNIEAVYEAASHRAFANHAYVVLEWSSALSQENLETVSGVCARFGVGLITLVPYYKSFRPTAYLEAETNMPSDDATDDFLSTVFAKRADIESAYNSLWPKNLTAKGK